MCLIVFSYKNHPRYPFILAANRDELYNRPTRKAGFWKEESSILGGKDLKGGGTWLGVSKDGKIAALTNYRNIKTIKDDAPTRGHIVRDFLSADLSPKSFLEALSEDSSRYNGFNLIAGTTEQLYYFNNQNKEIHEISPGNHVISNAFLNTPWPKTDTALQQFEEVIKQSEPKEEDFFQVLGNTTRFPYEKLPETGLPEEMEKAVSSVFIKTPGYGTRCSTLLLVDKNRELEFIERSYLPGTNEPDETVCYSFAL